MDVAQQATERGLDWPELTPGREKPVEIPQSHADALADALEDLEEYGEDDETLDQFTVQRVIEILRSGGVILVRIAGPLAGDDARPFP